MKRTVFGFTAAALLATGSAPAELIAVEDFDGGTPTWTNDTSSQLFVDPSSSGSEGLFIQAASTDNANFSGNSLFGQDLLGESGEPSLPSPWTFTFDNIDTSAYTDLVVSFDYAVSANADAGSYILVIDGVDQAPVEFYNDPDSGVETGTPTIIVGTANTIGLKITGTLNGGSDTLELDNFEINGVPEPGSLALLGLGGLLVVRRRRG